MKIFSKFGFNIKSALQTTFKFQVPYFKQFCKYSRDLPHLNVGTIGI